MDENVAKESPPGGFNKIDLSQLQGFSFGTQWTQDKESPADRRVQTAPRPRREDRLSGPGEPGPDRRDRRAFRKPEAHDLPAGAGGPPRAPRQGGARRDPMEDRAPYDSPHFAATFYPEETSFATLVKTIRASCRTIELFEIARTVLDKPERFTIHVARRETAPAAVRAPLFISVPDGLPFENEEAALSHVFARHMGAFFDMVEVEVEPPKGNFLVVNRCGLTGELLAPPNYHRYSQIIQQFHSARLARMPFETFKSRIETVRDPEAVSQWLGKMKKVTRYTWKGSADAPVSFDAFEEARSHLLASARDRMVRTAAHARIHGRDADALPDGEIRRAAEGALEGQRRFPLETANALRGRLRREHFTIFKKGSKGVSYVCAVKRKVRSPEQTFAENIGQVIAFIEVNPLVKVGELAGRFLGFTEEPTGELREKAARLHGDVAWLVKEGYVTEFIDGGLYCPPPIAASRKETAEADAEGGVEEVDPENFPEASLPEAN